MKNFTKTVAALSLVAMAGSFTACGESDKTVGITEEAAGIADNDLSSDSKDPESSSSTKKSSSSKNESSSSSVEESSSSKGDVSSSSKGDVSSSSKDDNSSSSFADTTTSKKVTGVSQKGPFLEGSTVTLQEVDQETFALSDNTLSDKIKNDKGDFEISYEELSSKYAVLTVEGLYRMEETGENSQYPIKLNALTDLTDRSTANVNVLTHLEFNRVKYLITKEGKSFNDAKVQAEKEILGAFGMPEIKDAVAEDLSIFGNTENDGALLALSVMLQASTIPYYLGNLLNSIAQDLEKDGVIDDKPLLARIADNAFLTTPSEVKQNILKWGISTEIPEFEKYITNFWVESYGIGSCTAENLGTSATITNESSRKYQTTFVCEEFGTDKTIMWRESPAEEEIGPCTSDEEGAVYDRFLACHSGKWIEATPTDIDGECTEDKYGDSTSVAINLNHVNNTRYVCDEGGWRLMKDLEKKLLNNCAKGNNLDVFKYYNELYMCNDSEWILSSLENISQALTECTIDNDSFQSANITAYYTCKDGQLVQRNYYQ